MENCFLSLVLFVIQRTRLYILDHSTSFTHNDEDVDCHDSAVDSFLNPGVFVVMAKL